MESQSVLSCSQKQTEPTAFATKLPLLHRAIHGEYALEIPRYIKRRNCQLRSFHRDKFVIIELINLTLKPPQKLILL